MAKQCILRTKNRSRRRSPKSSARNPTSPGAGQTSTSSAPTPALLLERLAHELAAVGEVAPSSVIAHLRCANIRMADLEKLDALLPRAPHFKRGISFVPEDGENEVWVFVEIG